MHVKHLAVSFNCGKNCSHDFYRPSDKLQLSPLSLVVGGRYLDNRGQQGFKSKFRMESRDIQVLAPLE
jgi:hypothetical protein